MPKQPNFFIIGAPKCGTTAMCHYLADHPNVFLCTPKEPNFFCEDLPRIREVRTLSDYLRLFESAGEGHTAIGDASVWCLYSAIAPGRIRDFDPQARIIVMLRNPVDFVYSLHSQFVFNGTERERDFERAWRRQDERSGALKQYRSIASFGAQMERLFGIFPASQVKVILFDDFSTDTHRSYVETLEFLGLEDNRRASFPKVNLNRMKRVDALSRIVKRTPRPLAVAAEQIKSAFGIRRLGILDAVHRLNTRTVTRPQLAPELRRSLAREFEPEVAKLERIIGRDLRVWKAEGVTG
jgi:hypothetical protein